MKPSARVLASVIGLGCCLIPACNSEDPSAMREGQKILAETLAKNSRLEEEIANLKADGAKVDTGAKADLEKDVQRLKTELEAAKAKIAQNEATKMPTPAEIEKKLDMESARLKEEARQQYAGATVVAFSTADLTIPSAERPFSCKAKMVLREPGGTQRTLYWTGAANIKGDWSFTKSDNWEPKLAAVDPPKVNPTSPDPALALDIPAVKPTPPPVKPTPPPVREKPKPKYDIQLDNPVMGPGAR